MVGLELFIVKGFWSTVEKVVFVVNFDFVHEEFSSFVREVFAAVVFVDFEGGPGEDLKQELQDDYKFFFHHGFIGGNDGFLLFFRDAFSVDF